MPLRSDSVQIKGKVHRTDEGYLSGAAVITRAGVFKYTNTDGSPRFELRHPVDVFDQESLSTLKMKPITNRHPWFGAVKADNIKQVQVGMTGEQIVKSHPHVISTVVINDSKAIIDIENGVQELSAGYKCDIIKEDGIYDGAHYQYRQKNIRYNHVALTDKGRAGPEVRLHLDELSKELGELDILFEDSSTLLTRGSGMIKFKIDSCEYDIPQEVEGFITKLSTELDTTKAERDTFKSRLDSFEKRDFEAEKKEAVKIRRGIEAAAIAIVDKTIVEKFDSLSDLEIKKAVISTVYPEIKLDNASDAYLDGCFNSAIVGKKSQDKLTAAAKNRSDSTERETADGCGKKGISSEDSLNRYKERISSAYKAKTSK